MAFQRRAERMERLDDPTLMNFIIEERWEEARDLVSRDSMAPYNVLVERHEADGHEIKYFPLTQLCGMVEFIEGMEDPEISDDEDEEEEFSQEDRQRNQEIYMLARLMIQQSHTIENPVFLPYVDQDEDDEETTYHEHRSILTLHNYSGWTALDLLCEESNDPQMMQILLERGQQSTNPFYPPLHRLMSREKPPYSSLQLLIQAFPDDRLVQECEFDHLPLHELMYTGPNPVSPRRLHHFLDGCRETLMVHNNTGDLPLQVCVNNHYVDERWERWNENERQRAWEGLEAILKVVVPPKDDDDWLPIHAIASGLAFIPTRMLHIALIFNGSAAFKYNKKGLLPLHVALSTQPTQEEDDMYGTQKV